MRKKLKAIISFMLSLLVVFLCIPGISAVLSPKEEESYHTPGGLFLNVKADAPSLEELFEGYEIERADLIKTVDLRPGYTVDCAEFVSSDDETLYEIIGYIYHIWLVDETREMLEEVVEKLLLSPYVNGATVNNYKEKPLPPITTPDEPTVPTVPIPPVGEIPDFTEPEWHPGRVLVSLKRGAPAFDQLLEGFEIETVRLLTPGSDSQRVYLVEFVEKTDEIVGKAINVLSASSCVISASPDYIGEYCEYDGNIVYWPDTTIIKGDANYDGKMDVKDATCIQKYLAGISIADVCGEYTNRSVVADFDTDGQITIKDATAIQKSIAGII